MIEVKHLCKNYGNKTAVKDLSFTIEKGHIYGFLGPNGAGKSTTMNIMTGCLAATSGTVSIDGYDIYEDSIKAKSLIGYLPELPPLYLDRTPREYLKFVAMAKGIKSSEISSAVEHVLEVTRITAVGDRLMKHLSKGYKQRVGIAQAILGNPDIIILDEPTVGLDPKQIIEIRDLIKSLGENHTVILSSHILSEVRAICDTIMIISAGRMVACDTPENLEKMFSGEAKLTVTADGTEEEILPLLETVPDITVSDLREEDGKTTLHIESQRDDPDEICRDVFRAFAATGRCILSMTAEKASLEDIFMELTDPTLRENEPETEKNEDTTEEDNSGYKNLFSDDGDDSALADDTVKEEEEEEKEEDNNESGI